MRRRSPCASREAYRMTLAGNPSFLPNARAEEGSSAFNKDNRMAAWRVFNLVIGNSWD